MAPKPPFALRLQPVLFIVSGFSLLFSLRFFFSLMS